MFLIASTLPEQVEDSFRGIPPQNLHGLQLEIVEIVLFYEVIQSEVVLIHLIEEVGCREEGAEDDRFLDEGGLYQVGEFDGCELGFGGG